MSETYILEGVTVLDFTHVVAGPYTTRVLADMGATVIKVDRIPDNPNGYVRSAGSISNNVGKKSISIDLKSEDGVSVALELASKADVVVENFKPGVMKELGLDYGTLSKKNPRIILASISGFGQTGSQSHRRAYGATAHAEAGLMWVQQIASRAHEPFAPGMTVADILTAMNTVSGILACLYHRERRGLGQSIDITLMESQLAMLSEVAQGPLTRGVPEKEWDATRHPVHAAKDGYVTININSLRNWRRIAKALSDENESMPDHMNEANQLVGQWVGGFTVEEVSRKMEETGAPYGIMRSLYEALENPYFSERDMIREISDPIEGKFSVINTPVHFSDSLIGPSSLGSPLAGQDTIEILKSIGYADHRISQLLESGVVARQIPK